MGFIEKLKVKDWLSVRNAHTRRSVLYTVDDATGEAVPLSAGQLGGGGGGGEQLALLERMADALAGGTVTTVSAFGLRPAAGWTALEMPDVATIEAVVIQHTSARVVRYTGAYNGEASAPSTTIEGPFTAGLYVSLQDDDPDAVVELSVRVIRRGPPIVATSSLLARAVAVLERTVAQVYLPEVLTVGASEASLTAPYDATHALVTVTAGSARLGLGNAASAPVFAVGEGVEISGAQLAALRLVREGTDATVRVDYWREG